MLLWLFNNCTSSAVNFSWSFQVYGDLIQYRQHRFVLLLSVGVVYEYAYYGVCAFWHMLVHLQVYCVQTPWWFIFSPVTWIIFWSLHFLTGQVNPRLHVPVLQQNTNLNIFLLFKFSSHMQISRKNILRLRHATDKYCKVYYS